MSGTKYLPVPAPLLGQLLAEIVDDAALKCTLRFLWYAAQVPGKPKWVGKRALESDDVLLRALGSVEAIQHGMTLAVRRGTLVEASGQLTLHTSQQGEMVAPSGHYTEGVLEPVAGEQPTVFSIYETNIGMLSPIIADNLRDAQETYPTGWIEEAIREAAERNVRNWRYIAAILMRWAEEGRGGATRGKPRRAPATISAAEYVRRFGIPRPPSR